MTCTLYLITLVLPTVTAELKKRITIKVFSGLESSKCPHFHRQNVAKIFIFNFKVTISYIK